MRNKIVLPAMIVFIIAAASGVNRQNSEFPDIGSFSKKKMGADRFLRVGRIERIVIPETTGSSLIAGVDKIVFSSNGNIYIGDYFSQKAIFRFDSQG